MNNISIDPKYDSYLRKKNALVTQIIDLRRRATKQKALLSLKYEYLLKKINIIQVSVIFCSTIITLLESLKGMLNLKELIWDLVPIFISTYITLIMAILRFFKWETQKENISKCHENHTNIINKLEKMYNIIISFEWDNDPSCNERWKNIVSSYEDELFDSFVSAKETFDTILSYKDIIFYKEKFKKLYLQMEFSNQDIELIRKGNNLEHKNYIKKNPWYMRLFCCYPAESIDMKLFLKDSYEKFGVIIDYDSMISSSSASSYEQYDKMHDNGDGGGDGGGGGSGGRRPTSDSMINNNHYFDDYEGVCEKFHERRKSKSKSPKSPSGSHSTLDGKIINTYQHNLPTIEENDNESVVNSDDQLSTIKKNIVQELDNVINDLGNIADGNIIDPEIVDKKKQSSGKHFSLTIDDEN